jgi:predicted transcriptional regulator
MPTTVGTSVLRCFELAATLDDRQRSRGQAEISFGYTAGVAKILVSIPDDLLERVDREAERRRTTRSALFQQAALHELGWPDADAIDSAIARGRGALQGVGSFESGDVIRQDREGRDARDRRRQ